MTSPAPQRPLRADHIGSLIRPPRLKQAREAHERGEISDADLRAAQDEAIRDVVALQEAAGLPVLTDGEFRRSTYSDSFTTHGISGVEIKVTEQTGWSSSSTHGHRMARRIPAVVDRIRWRSSENVEDFRFTAAQTDRTVKITLPGPAYIHYRAGRENISREVYPNLDDFWADLVAAYHAELRALSEAGCTYVQLDETSLVKLGDARVRELLAERGDDWQALLGTYVDAVNAVVAGAPDGMLVGIHVCRSQDPNWQADAGYGAIAEALFRDMKISRYLLEYDNPRAGGFEPLAMLPEGKTVVLGLVSSYRPEMETADGLIARVREAARHVPLEQLAVSPQCGFSTAAELQHVTEDIEKAKLTLVADVARTLWPE